MGEARSTIPDAEVRHERGRGFLRHEARLLEQRLYQALFEDGSPAGVVDALRGYQNEDGGFGHGLEPDKRCPASLPMDVEVALEALVDAGAVDEPMVLRACGYLASVADPSGAVPLAFPVIESYPRAEHWTDWTYVPGLFPTAGLAGLLVHLGIEHLWVDAATGYCWAALEDGIPDEAHTLRQVLLFLEHAAEPGQVEALLPAIAEQLPRTTWYRADPDDETYGVTPLYLAPTPDSPWRALFDDALIAGHLDRLRRDQQPDGGWPLAWEPPSRASTLEWRGIETLRALRVLDAYGA